MRAIYEPNVDGVDYLELILTPKELNQMQKKGVAKEFREGLYQDNTLNIFIRVEREEANAV